MRENAHGIYVKMVELEKSIRKTAECKTKRVISKLVMRTYPSLVRECFEKWFSFPEQMVHGQVVTASTMPHVRTMGLYEITREGALVFLTRNDTTKWNDLTENPRAAVCFVNLDHGQIIAEGDVKLKTKRESSESLQYWNAMEPSIRKIYLPYKEGEISESFGVIFIKPTSWEVLQIRKEDYCLSTRTKFLLDAQGSWKESTLTPV